MPATRSKVVLGPALLGLVLLAAGAPPAFADLPPNYRYVEAGYLSVDVDDLDGSGDNYFVAGSLGGSWWQIPLYFSNGELGDDFDLRTWRAGFGAHGGLGYKADIVGQIEYVDQSIDGPGGSSDSDTGYRLVGGVRWQALEFFELDGFANFNDVGDESDLSWEGRAILTIWRLGFGASYEKFDDADQWNAFVRFNFRRK